MRCGPCEGTGEVLEPRLEHDAASKCSTHECADCRGSGVAPSVTVQERGGRRFFELGGRDYFSDDLPQEGTDVDASAYEGTDDCWYADASWSADTPSGQGAALAKAE